VTLLPATGHPDFQLRHSPGAGDGRLELHGPAGTRPLSVDFLAGPTARRGLRARRRDHPLARAVGRHRPLARILDATAGLGRDAFVLAKLGYRVDAVERDPVLHALLADGWRRLQEDPGGAEGVAERLRVHLGDARDWFADAPEVVYLDPMFPARRKSALVKKEMQWSRILVGGADPDVADREACELLAGARQAGARRIVVKRPAGAATLAADPDFSVRAGLLRWDVYLGPAPG
jgi:16S rRNA (guanine1516-N2)-methyltransferase